VVSGAAAAGDGKEIVRDEGRAPDQAAVDIGLGKQLGGGWRA
jgi:hypothetical protein